MDGHKSEAQPGGSMACEVSPLEDADPRTIGGYPLLGRIGTGGMGTVFLAREPDTSERVAVKTIHPRLAGDAKFRERLREEAVMASRVASFCTARVLDYGEDASGLPYIVSEYVGGMSLQRRLLQSGPLPAADLHGVAVGVAAGLSAVHAAGLIHGDVKPANVILTLSGPRVIDFGVSRKCDSPTPAPSGTVVGTPGWVPPEVIKGGPPTPAADVFGWGCLVAYAGTGRLPFGDGEPTEVALRTANEEPDLSDVPPDLLPTVRAALAKNPVERPTAPDLLLSLVGYPASPEPTPAVPASAEQPPEETKEFSAVA